MLKPVYWVILLISLLPAVIINLVQLQGTQINDMPLENAIYAGFCILAVPLYVRRLPSWTLIAPLLLTIPVLIGVMNGNRPLFIAKDAALLVQLGITFLVYENVFGRSDRQTIRRAFLIAGLLQAIQLAVFSQFLPAKQLSIDHILITATPLFFVGFQRCISLILFAGYIFLFMQTIGFAFLGLIFGLGHTLVYWMSQAVLKFRLSKSGIWGKTILSVLMFISMSAFAVQGPALVGVGGYFTTGKSLEIRFRELDKLRQRPLTLQLVGEGFGSENDYWNFHEYPEFSIDARLRVFHFGIAWVLSKCGFIGLALYAITCVYLIYRFFSLFRAEATWMYFAGTAIALTTLGSNVTFALALKSCVTPLAVMVALRDANPQESGNDSFEVH